MQERIAVFGGNGQLGYDFVKAASGAYHVVSLAQVECDVTDLGRVNAVLGEIQPSVVVNCAAFHKIDACEREPEKAFQVNAVGAYHVAKSATEHGARVVYMSTDYVFDGVKESFDEYDTTRPLTVYGASKLSGEHLTRIANPGYCIVRSSALFGITEGTKGSNFVARMISLGKEGKPIKVVDDQKTAPTYTVDLAGKILELIERAEVGTFHVTNAGSCTWYELALEALQAAGIETTIEKDATDFSKAPQRPRNSVLISSMLPRKGVAPLPQWQDAVARFVRESGLHV